MNQQTFRERECVHRAAGIEGEYYKGDVYVRHLMRLKSSVAVNFSGKVTSFFWSDAANVLVWLCDDCASELAICVRQPSLVG
jgi:hypothetical protein